MRINASTRRAEGREGAPGSEDDEALGSEAGVVQLWRFRIDRVVKVRKHVPRLRRRLQSPFHLLPRPHPKPLPTLRRRQKIIAPRDLVQHLHVLCSVAEESDLAVLVFQIAEHVEGRGGGKGEVAGEVEGEEVDQALKVYDRRRGGSEAVEDGDELFDVFVERRLVVTDPAERTPSARFEVSTEIVAHAEGVKALFQSLRRSLC